MPLTPTIIQVMQHMLMLTQVLVLPIIRSIIILVTHQVQDMGLVLEETRRTVTEPQAGGRITVGDIMELMVKVLTVVLILRGQCHTIAEVAMLVLATIGLLVTVQGMNQGMGEGVNKMV